MRSIVRLFALLATAASCSPSSSTDQPPPAKQPPVKQTATDNPPPPAKPKVPKASVLNLATTTSTRDSGLLDLLVPAFEKKTSTRVAVIAVGTGKALKIGAAGDADVVFVHSRPAEDAFMKQGHGIRREDVMYNSFEILGPKADPAQIKGKDPLEALKLLSQGKHPFISRGDDSGTHKKELALQKQASVKPDWPGYVETGQGMGASLVVADQKNAYILTDRGTYLRFRDKIQLAALTAPAEAMRNPYGIMVVNHKGTQPGRTALAQQFVDFIISPEIQQVIADYKIKGEAAFVPLRLPAGN